MKRFYNHKTKSFYIDEINDAIPENSVEITEEQHSELYNAINAGCIIFDDLTHSEPPPTPFHEWDSKAKNWLSNKDAQQKYITNQNTAMRDSLLDKANKEIDILNRAVKLRRASDTDKQRLELLENYTIDLYELDLTISDLVFPKLP